MDGHWRIDTRNNVMVDNNILFNHLEIGFSDLPEIQVGDIVSIYVQELYLCSGKVLQRHFDTRNKHWDIDLREVGSTLDESVKEHFHIIKDSIEWRKHGIEGFF